MRRVNDGDAFIVVDLATIIEGAMEKRGKPNLMLMSVLQDNPSRSDRDESVSAASSVAIVFGFWFCCFR